MKLKKLPGFSDSDFDAWVFLSQAKKYARHYHNNGKPRKGCMICEALAEIEAGQGAVSDLLIGREMPF